MPANNPDAEATEKVAKRDPIINRTYSIKLLTIVTYHQRRNQPFVKK